MAIKEHRMGDSGDEDGGGGEGKGFDSASGGSTQEDSFGMVSLCDPMMGRSTGQKELFQECLCMI